MHLIGMKDRKEKYPLGIPVCPKYRTERRKIMDKASDKCILFVFACLQLAGSGGREHPVVAMLTALTVTALSIYMEGKSFSYMRYILLAVILLTAFAEPEILLFFPVFLYDLVYDKKYILIVPFLPAAAMHSPDTAERAALWLCVTALSVLLAVKTRKKQFLAKELIRIRDSGEELNLLLKEKNENLLEKQDYEIYLATLKERNRIAREIHDNVGHLLSRSILMTGALLTVEKEGMVHEQLLNMKETLDQAMNSIRESVHGLHDDSVDLKQAVMEISDSMKGEYDVKFSYDMSEYIPSRVKYCLIAVLKEGVSNILKHSNGNRVQIGLREHPGFYQLSIEDNGTGAKAEAGKGIGLQNMKERAETLGGTFHIYTNRGFVIFMTIPKTEG